MEDKKKDAAVELKKLSLSERREIEIVVIKRFEEVGVAVDDCDHLSWSSTAPQSWQLVLRVKSLPVEDAVKVGEVCSLAGWRGNLSPQSKHIAITVSGSIDELQNLHAKVQQGTATNPVEPRPSFNQQNIHHEN